MVWELTGAAEEELGLGAGAAVEEATGAGALVAEGAGAVVVGEGEAHPLRIITAANTKTMTTNKCFFTRIFLL
jgi:hypothetical protein